MPWHVPHLRYSAAESMVKAIEDLIAKGGSVDVLFFGSPGDGDAEAAVLTALVFLFGLELEAANLQLELR